MPTNHLQRAIAWIADNDELTWQDSGSVAGLISVVLVADVWDLDPVDVATRVIRRRRTRTLAH